MSISLTLENYQRVIKEANETGLSYSGLIDKRLTMGYHAHVSVCDLAKNLFTFKFSKVLLNFISQVGRVCQIFH